MDGAGPLQMLRHVTLPMLRPLLVTLVVVSTIWDFKIFDQVYVMTGGGPYRSTELAAITVWREAVARPPPRPPPAPAGGAFPPPLVLPPAPLRPRPRAPRGRG